MTTLPLRPAARRRRAFALTASAALVSAMMTPLLVGGPARADATLVAAYSFDEASGTTSADASGNGHTGTQSSGVTRTTAGKFGGALVFNGSSGLVTIPDAADLRLTSGMTLEAWVKPTNTSTLWRDIIYKGNDNYYLEGSSSSGGRPAGGSIPGGSYREAFGTAALTAATWAHLALTYDGTAMRLFVNGTQVGTANATGAMPTSTNPLQIGGDSIYGQYFNGTIDEVRVYNVARTAAQIQSDMNASVGAPDTTPPTAPASLTATANGTSSINLSWSAATDNVGVTGYRVERCSGSTCTFTQIATPTTTTFSDTGLAAGTTYSYRVRAVDAALNLGPYSPTASDTTATPDTTPPTAPGSLTATSGGTTSISLSWQVATDNVGVTGYRVERCSGSTCTFTQIAAPTTTTFSDTGLAAGTSYSYRVRAIDAALNLGPYSNVATATTDTPDTTPPTAPGSLTATSGGTTSISLSWQAATDNVGVTGYRVERCSGSTCTFTQIAAPTTTSYSDTGLAAGTSYSYRVRAIDAALNLGPYSNVATATTDTPPPDSVPPGAPGTLTATADSTPAVTLNWGAATDNVAVTGYRINRCSGAGCTDLTHLVQLDTPVTTFTDTRVSASTSYTYVVAALDAAGNIGPSSNQATASTPAPATNLIAAYGFGETSGTTVTDSSGQGHTGTITGATRTSAGKYGQALSFNGTTAQVSVSDAADLHLTTGMTVEAWVNPSSAATNWADVIYKGDDNYYLESSSTVGGVPAGGGIVTGGHKEAYGASQLPANTWTHLALTYDGAAMRLYVNANLVSSTPATGAMATSTQPLQIGGDSIYGQHFAGLIDEVRVYNVARTALQLQSDMNTAVGSPTDPDPPTTPTSLTATAGSGSQINLSWQGSTDNVAVTGYQVERCTGGTCADFAQVGTSTTTTFQNTALAPFTEYRYRVRAYDAAGNLSGYSNIANASTGTGITPHVLPLTPGRTQQFTLSGASGSITWAVDNVTGGNATIGTISGTGLYTAPSAEGTHAITATAGSTTSDPATVYVTSYAGTLTHHNNTERTGANLDETILTPARVNSAGFGKAFTFSTDGVSHASPLYAQDVSITGAGVKNVVFVATEHDSVYAFDADGGSTVPLWRTSFINPGAGITTVPAADTGECCDIQPEIGITGTPVIDPVSRTLYVVAKTKEVSGSTTNYVQKLHALNIADGTERSGSPVVINASVPGTGNGSSGGTLAFNSLRENQRPALLLRGGVVYLGFASHGDNQPYHGWILGYDATSLSQVLALCLTPNGEGAGVWHGGGGLASDSSGDVYYVTGDGTFSASTGGRDYGDSVVRMRPNGTVADYFTPYNQATLDSGNIDLGAGGVLLLPDQTGTTHTHLMVTAGKNGTIYLIDRDAMGHFNAADDSQIVQSLPNIFPNGTPEPGNFTSPVYWNGFVYFSPVADKVEAFSLTNGRLSTSPTMKSSTSLAFPGGSLAVSADGTNGGILWVAERTSASTNGILHAYDARNNGATLTELWNSNQSGSRDTLDIAAKYSVPLVANGRVYVSTVSTVTVYSLLG